MKKIAMYVLSGCLATTIAAGSAAAAGNTARTTTDLDDISYRNQVYNSSGAVYNNRTDGFNAYSTNGYNTNTGNNFNNNGAYRTRALADNDNDGFDWGWLGLLGLLGLAGMRSRSRERDHA